MGRIRGRQASGSAPAPGAAASTANLAANKPLQALLDALDAYSPGPSGPRREQARFPYPHNSLRLMLFQPGGSATTCSVAARNLSRTGIGLSSEYVYAVKPGVPIPDDRFFAVLWVDRSTAEAAFDMKGAFNDLVVSLAPGADAKPVIAELDRLLEPYGSVGAVERRDQPSNRFLEDELNQQKTMSITIPIIFFGVAAFLLNAALGRQVAAQREQISPST